jgi:DNA-binding GntR family transcriptional regulator
VPRGSRQSASTDPDTGGYQPMAQAVAQNIRQAIFDGTLKPGEPVRQEAFAKELGTSRIPVREALRQLESEGLVSIRPHASARVAIVDFDECMELYKMRERLEPLAFAESTKCLTEEQIAYAASLCERIDSLTDDPAAWIDADRRFHLACYAGLPFKRLLRAVEGYWNVTQQYRRIVLATFNEHDFVSFQAEHMLIVDAMRSRNLRAGEDLVRMAIERARLRLEQNRHLFDV